MMLVVLPVAQYEPNPYCNEDYKVDSSSRRIFARQVLWARFT